MSYTYTEHTCDGVQTTFPFRFAGHDRGYIRAADIHVEAQKDGSWSAVSNWKLTGTNQITFSSAPESGLRIRIRRIVDKEYPYAEFDRGVTLDMKSLNNTFTQNLQATQELLDGFLPEGFYLKDDLDMGGHRITNVGDAVDEGDAVNKGVTDELGSRLEVLEQSVTGASRFVAWQYNASGGEMVLKPPYSFNGARVFINGVRQRAGALGSFTVKDNTIYLSEPLFKDDWVDVELGTEPSDTTLNERAVLDISNLFTSRKSVDWQPNTPVLNSLQLFRYQENLYLPDPSKTPFTTTSVFNPEQFILVSTASVYDVAKVFYGSGSKSAVEVMIDSYIPANLYYSTGGTTWFKHSEGNSISNFLPVTRVCATDFGIVVNDPTKSEYNVAKSWRMLKLLLNCNKPNTIDGIGASYHLAQLKPEVYYPSGIYYFGNNPFKLPASEYAETSDKVMGIKFSGAGIESTIFELRKRAGFVGTINFYTNNGQPDVASGKGGWKNITFEDMTLRSPYFNNNNPVAMAKRRGDDWYSFSYTTSGGWEKFFKFNRVSFQGFDEVQRIEGASNCDENHFTNCRFEVIRENLLYLNNDQSVIHRFTDCDFEGLHGSFVRAKKGGFVVVNGGSLILYPEFNEQGAIVRGAKAAIFNIEPSGSSIDSRAGVYKMRDVSVEKYDPNYQFARVVQQGSVVDVGDETLVPRYPASVADIDFIHCSYRIDSKHHLDTVNEPRNHEVVTVLGDVLSKIDFTDCELHQRHLYRLDPTSSEYSDGGYLRFTRPRLAWDVSKKNVYSEIWEGGTLAERCTTTGSRAIIAEGVTCITTPAWKHKAYNYALDFKLGKESVFSFPSVQKEAYLKRKGEPLLSTGATPTRSGNTLFMYEGATIEGLRIRIPKLEERFTGSVLVYAGSTLLHSEVVDLQVGCKKEILIPYEVQHTLAKGEYLHVKWGSYSGTGTEVPLASYITVLYR